MDSESKQPGKGLSGEEMRGHKRVAVSLPVECRSAQQTVSGRAENLAVGGILVRAQETLEWDEPVTVTLQLPGVSAPVEVVARVAHVVPGIFMGLEFTRCPAEVLDRIQQYISSVVPPPRR